MVNGWCFGGAFTPIVACDLAIAADEATFGLSEVNWGIIPAGNVTKATSETIGLSQRALLRDDGRDRSTASRRPRWVSSTSRCRARSSRSARRASSRGCCSTKNQTVLRGIKIAMKRMQYMDWDVVGRLSLREDGRGAVLRRERQPRERDEGVPRRQDVQARARALQRDEDSGAHELASGGAGDDADSRASAIGAGAARRRALALLRSRVSRRRARGATDSPARRRSRATRSSRRRRRTGRRTAATGTTNAIRRSRRSTATTSRTSKACGARACDGSGVGTKYSGEAQPLVYDGVVYVVDGRRRRVRDRRRQRRDPLVVRGESRRTRTTSSAAAGRAAASGSATARCSSASSTASSSRSIRRPARSRGRCKPSAGRTGFSDHERAALLRRARHHGLRRRRVRHPRPREGVRREDGKLVWTFYTIPGPGELGPRHVAAGQRRVEARRRVGLADAGRRSRARAHLSSRRATRAPTTTAPCAPATTCSSASIVALDAKTGEIPLALPAGASRHLGLRRPEPRRAVRSRVRTARCAKASRSRARRAGSTSSTARTASRSSASTSSPCRRSRAKRPPRRSPTRAATRSCRSRSTSRPKASRS